MALQLRLVAAAWRSCCCLPSLLLYISRPDGSRAAFHLTRKAKVDGRVVALVGRAECCTAEAESDTLIRESMRSASCSKVPVFACPRA